MNRRRRKADRERLRNYLWLRMYLPDGDEAAEVLFPELHQQAKRQRDGSALQPTRDQSDIPAPCDRSHDFRSS